MSKNTRLPWRLALVPAAVSLLFFVLPYIAALALASGSFNGAAGGSAGAGGGLPPNLFRIILWTFTQAVLSAALALITGLPAAYIASAPGFKHQGLVRTLTSVPFALPSILFVLGFILFWGNSGYFNKFLLLFAGDAPETPAPVQILYRPAAVIFAHACFNFPLVMQFSQSTFYKIRRSYAFCAASLGAGPARRFFSVILPLAVPSIAGAAILTFLYCWTSFALVLILGGGPAGTTLAVEIYRYARITLNYGNAGLLSLIETAVACGAFLLYLRFEKKNRLYFPVQSPDGRTDEAAKPGGEFRASAFAAGLLKSAYFVLAALLLLAPLASIIIESFLVPSGRSHAVFGLKNYSAAASGIAAAAGRSVILALISSALSCTLALLAGEAVLESDNMALSNPGLKKKAGILSNILKFCTVSPVAASGIVLGLGFIALYGRDAVRTMPALVIMHSLISLPFAYNAVHTSLSMIPKSVLDAARVCGSPPLTRILTVDIPVIKDRIKSAFGFCACISAGELNCVLMSGIDMETLPLYIYRAVSAYRYNTACAAGAVLILCCLLTLHISHSASRNKAALH